MPAFTFSTATVQIGQSTKKSDYDRLLNNTRYLASGTNTVFVRQKTFNSSTVFLTKPKVDGVQSRTSTSGVFVAGNYQSGTVHYAKNFKMVSVALGPWNMDSTPTKTYSASLFGLTSATIGKLNILNVEIRTDMASITSTSKFPLMYAGFYYVYTYQGKVSLFRTTGSTFDNSNYDSSGSFNRGWIHGTIIE
jgi:hypothetical protein